MELIAQVLENLIKYHHFNLITVQNLDTCYLKAAKRLDLIGFDNSTCWYFSFKLHITISILHSWATSFSCLFFFLFFIFLEGANTSASEISSSIASAFVSLLLISEVKHHIIMHEWIARLQIVVFPSLSIKHWVYICSKHYSLHGHQTLVLAWTGIDCTCPWGGRHLEMPLLCCRALCYSHHEIKIFFFCSVQSQWDDNSHENSWVFQHSGKLTPSQCKNAWNLLASVLAVYDDEIYVPNWVWSFHSLMTWNYANCSTCIWFWCLEWEWFGFAVYVPNALMMVNWIANTSFCT